MNRRITLASSKMPSSQSKINLNSGLNIKIIDKRTNSAGRQTITGISSHTNQNKSFSLTKYIQKPTALSQEPKLTVDKGEMNYHVENIFNYLSTSNFSQKEFFSSKIMKQPSSKTFHTIFNYLIEQIDPNLKDLSEDKIPGVLKHLNYPYNLPKATFIALSAPHTWPSILCLLNWMVEIEISLQRHNEISKTEKKENHKDSVFQYSIKTFNANEQLRFEKTNELIETLGEGQMELENESKEEVKKIETIQNNIKSLKESQPDISELDNSLLKIEQEIKKELEKIEIEEKDEMVCDNLLETLNNDINKHEEENKSKISEIEQLEFQISKQSMKKEEEEIIINDIIKQEQYKQNLAKTLNEKIAIFLQQNKQYEEITSKNDMILIDIKDIIKKYPELFSAFSFLIKDVNWNYFKENKLKIENLNDLFVKKIVKEIWNVKYKSLILPKFIEFIEKSKEKREKLEENVKLFIGDIEKLEISNKDYEELNRKYKENIEKNNIIISDLKIQLEENERKFQEKKKTINIEIEKLRLNIEKDKKIFEKLNEEIIENMAKISKYLTEYESIKKELEIMKKQDLNKFFLLRNEMIENLELIRQIKEEYSKILLSLADF